MSLLTWIWRIIRGPYDCVETESCFDQQLFYCTFGSFNILVSYELHLYQYRFSKWFIPNGKLRHVVMYGSAEGNPPMNIVEALKKPVFLSLGPGKGDDNITNRDALRMSIFFNDVLVARTRSPCPAM